MTKAILINYDYCTGCHSCEVACKKILGLPKGEFGIKVAEVGPFQYSEREGVKGVWEWTYLPIITQACDLCADRTGQARCPCACSTARHGACTTARRKSSSRRWTGKTAGRS